MERLRNIRQVSESGYQRVLTDITQKCWVDYVTPIPEGLDSAAVTPLLCAVSHGKYFQINLLTTASDPFRSFFTQGLTIYKALKESNAKPGQWVSISGAGGGLGHLGELCGLTIDFLLLRSHICVSLGIQFAVAMGLRVVAIGGCFWSLSLYLVIPISIM